MATRGRLQAAGYTPIPHTAKHYRAPDGREVSYRQAFRAARGESLERATANNAVRERGLRGAAREEYLSSEDAKRGRSGKFREEFRLARRVRELARSEELTQRVGLSESRERAIAESSLRQLTKGHYRTPKHAPDTGEFAVDYDHPPEHESPYGQVLALLEDTTNSDNGPDSAKARLLVSLGYRSAGADYDVGETP